MKYFDWYAALQDDNYRFKTAMVAKTYLAEFETLIHSDGNVDRESIIAIKSDPKGDGPIREEVTQLVISIHDNFLMSTPDNWCYEAIRDALTSIYNCDADPEADFEFADQHASYYSNYQLKKWLCECDEGDRLVDEAVSELGHSENGVVGDIMTGLFNSYRSVYQWCIEKCAQRADDLIIRDGKLVEVLQLETP